jgi:hypothetical protein
MRQYELYRIPHPSIKITDKRYLDRGSLKRLFSGPCILEEKLDGSQMGISFKGGAPYVQTKNSHLLESDKRVAFKGAWAWVWENIEAVEMLKGFTVFGEWLYIQHNIHYDNLPSYFIAFDVYSHEAKRYLLSGTRHSFLRKRGIAEAPTLAKGKLNIGHVFEILRAHGKSFYSGELLEGGVVKNLPKQQFGKMVLQEFLEDLDEGGHWTGHTPKYNQLSEGLEFGSTPKKEEEE